MTMYRLLLALLFGIGFSALVPLLLGVPFMLVAVPAMFFVFPGFLVAGIFHTESPLLIMAGNAALYPALAYVLLCAKRISSPAFLRLLSIWLVVPVAALVVLSRIPSLNPLLPARMAELGRQEAELQNAFPDSTNVEQARAVLRSKNIQFNEFEPSTGLVFQRGSTTMTASYGDRVIHSQFQTNAGQFPCGYDMEIDLLFDATGKLKQRYIHRFRVCL